MNRIWEYGNGWVALSEIEERLGITLSAPPFRKRPWQEEKHPRDEKGRFAPKGRGTIRRRRPDLDERYIFPRGEVEHPDDWEAYDQEYQERQRIWQEEHERMEALKAKFPLPPDLEGKMSHELYADLMAGVEEMYPDIVATYGGQKIWELMKEYPVPPSLKGRIHPVEYAVMEYEDDLEQEEARKLGDEAVGPFDGDVSFVRVQPPMNGRPAIWWLRGSDTLWTEVARLEDNYPKLEPASWDELDPSTAERLKGTIAQKAVDRLRRDYEDPLREGMLREKYGRYIVKKELVDQMKEISPASTTRPALVENPRDGRLYTVNRFENIPGSVLLSPATPDDVDNELLARIRNPEDPLHRRYRNVLSHQRSLDDFMSSVEVYLQNSRDYEQKYPDVVGIGGRLYKVEEYGDTMILTVAEKGDLAPDILRRIEDPENEEHVYKAHLENEPVLPLRDYLTQRQRRYGHLPMRSKPRATDRIYNVKVLGQTERAIKFKVKATRPDGKTSTYTTWAPKRMVSVSEDGKTAEIPEWFWQRKLQEFMDASYDKGTKFEIVEN